MRILILTAIAVCAWGQAANPAGAAAPAFEAASVKPNHSASGHSSSHTRPANIQMTNEPLLRLITMAYEVKDYQVEGPAWIRSERYDVVAKAPVGTPERSMDPMMRTLLEDRFKLKAHRETKELPVYGLVAVKGGIRLTPVEAGGGSGLDHDGDEHGGVMKGTHITMPRLAEWLSRMMDRPVLDMSGIPGAYDFTLRYTKESEQGDAGGIVRYPVLPLAIQDQLGLRLEKRTAPIEVLVIEQAEKVPIEN
jgi:uncharacterized protein (TIGR03435 family)